MKENILIQNNPKSPIAEAYRTLRTNIQFASIDKEVKTIVVTSSGASEGKTTTAMNLAVAFTHNDEKVLLIDSDLRKPRLHKKFEFENNSGLTNILLGKKNLGECLKKYEKLSILTSGPIPPNPAEILGSKKMKAFLDEIKSKYDRIIIDSSPIGFVTDSTLLSSFSDGTLLVVAAGQTDGKVALYAKEQLTRANANILGVILTKVPVKTKGYYKYHYASYYGYTDDKEKS